MHRALAALVAATSFGLSTPAGAESPMSYSHLDVQYFNGRSDVNNVDIDSDGVILKANLGFADYFFVYVNYADGSLDGKANINKIDIQETVYGIGGHYPLMDNLDLVARLGHDTANFDGGLDVESWVFDPTLRLRFLDQFEVEGGVAYLYTTSKSVSDDSTFIFNVEGRWFFIPNAAFTLGARIDDSGDNVTGNIGVRWNFGS